MAQKRVLSGIRATGRLHLGNYLGAVKGMLALHTLTTPYDPKSLKKDVREVVLDYLAAGLDPEKSTIFVQSQVPDHVELSYLFSTVISLARMQHLPTYKERYRGERIKYSELKDTPPVAFFEELNPVLWGRKKYHANAELVDKIMNE